MSREQFRLTWREVLHWLLRRRKRFNIGGSSMHPVLREDEDVLLRPYRRGEKIYTGDIVIARHPIRENLLIVKQIAEADYETGKYYLAGLNAEQSTDSRSFGPIGSHLILGKVTAVLG